METETFQNGTGWFITSFSKTAVAAPIEIRDDSCVLDGFQAPIIAFGGFCRQCTLLLPSD